MNSATKVNSQCYFFFLEEILEQSRAFWFSKTGEKLLYATFDATNVHEVTLDKSFKQSEDCDFFKRRRKREAQDYDYENPPEGKGLFIYYARLFRGFLEPPTPLGEDIFMA